MMHRYGVEEHGIALDLLVRKCLGSLFLKIFPSWKDSMILLLKEHLSTFGNAFLLWWIEKNNWKTVEMFYAIIPISPTSLNDAYVQWTNVTRRCLFDFLSLRLRERHKMVKKDMCLFPISFTVCMQLFKCKHGLS